LNILFSDHSELPVFSLSVGKFQKKISTGFPVVLLNIPDFKVPEVAENRSGCCALTPPALPVVPTVWQLTVQCDHSGKQTKIKFASSVQSSSEINKV